MVIRKMKNSEVNFLNEMLYEAIYVPEGMPPYPRSLIFEPEIFKYIKDWGRPGDNAWVAEDNKKLIGAAWGRLYKYPETGYGYIDDNTPEISMAVMENFRNKGIGTQLLETLIEQYSKMNITSLSLSVDKRNRAVQLYRKLGFQVVNENEIDYIMQLVLLK
jgi:[ribosomal protein S18]-alanine N-acetyltransferase